MKLLCAMHIKLGIENYIINAQIRHSSRWKTETTSKIILFNWLGQLVSLNFVCYVSFPSCVSNSEVLDFLLGKH